MLVVMAMVLGIYGGRLAGSTALILSAETFDRGLADGFKPFNVTFSLIKAYTFAFIISSIPAYYGYYVKGGALEIGRSSTKSVVVSCIMILLADYALAALLL
jgi:phospholipid/cholesterol/gamma-HCH transport system permease protein